MVNLGLNGRTIPHSKRETDLALFMLRNRLPAELLIIMLGSNDAFLMDDPTAEKIAARMDAFLYELTKDLPGLPVFLISPPPVEIPLENMQDLFMELIPAYRKLAAKYNTLFAAAPLWDLPIAADGVHFTPEAHKEFALQVEKHLKYP